jgi:hypothetical protein
MRSVLVLAPALVIVLLAAGCIAPDPSPGTPAGARTQNSGGEMTSKEARNDAVAPCTTSPLGTSGAFCATRTITVTGTISGIRAMDVDVSSFNGNVKLHAASSGQWGFVATLRARGATADEAKANLDNIQFAWSHEQGGTHFLSASAKKDGEGSGYSADFDVTLTPEIAYSVVASTTNGNAALDGLTTTALALRTTNGDIDATATVTQAQLSTTNGGVKATLQPAASGRITATTTNGGVTLAVPEDAQHGYQATLKTTNGRVNVGTKDGDASPCPTGEYYTPPCNERTFQTKDYGSRAVQDLVTIASTNGDVSLQPS